MLTYILTLHIDETAEIALILRSHASEDDLIAFLPNIEVTFSAHATDAVPQGNGNTASASGKHDLTSSKISSSQSVDVVARDGFSYAIWRPTLHLPRPRIRLQRPAVYFTAQMSLHSDVLLNDKETAADYLASLEPLPTNILEPLQFDPSLKTASVSLSEARVTKVAQSTDRPSNDLRPLRGATKRAFPIVPALFTRIRYSLVPEATIASLHLETSEVVSGSVVLQDVGFRVPNARVERLDAISWPVESSLGDEIVLLYKLRREQSGATASPSPVSVQVEATVIIEAAAPIKINVSYENQVDLSQAVAKTTYKWSTRPLSHSGPLHASRVSTSSIEAMQQTSSDGDGVLFTFWAPTIIPSRKAFKINVQCINKSNRSRRFAIVIAQPKKLAALPHREVKAGTSDPVTDVFKAPPVDQAKAPDVFDMNPDVRIGPLLPGASHETELKFWAATTGLLDLGIVRIVDLETRQTIDMKELPDVVVLDPNDG